MTVVHYLLAALGLALLMVVHEGGHFIAARRSGMRVVKFSIGFGPVLYKHQPKNSSTTYQIAIIPFLAYVQIAGMNPYEEIDPKDPGSYANASLWGRIVTIFAGPLANYLFASVLFFAGYMISGRAVADEHSMRITVYQEGPARVANLHDGDHILTVNGDAVPNWDFLKHAIGAHPGERIDLGIERGHDQLTIPVTPGAKGDKHFEGKIGILPEIKMVKVSVGQALVLSVEEPAKFVGEQIVGIARLFAGERPELSGPVGIVKQAAGAVRSGAGDAFPFLAQLSAYLGFFNLLPIPALDGGRLLFLAFEAASRRRADAKIEAKVHAIGLLMMITLIAAVTYTEIVPKP